MGSVSYCFILVLEDTFCDPSGIINERSADMKTSLTIATIALVFSVILSLVPTVATAEYSGKTAGRCGVVPCQNQQQVQRTSWPTPSYRGIR